MRILAIETSCDETAIAMLECSGDPRNGEVFFNVLSNVVFSQVALHAEYGGVFPSLAKREHSRNLIPVLKRALEQGFGIFNFSAKGGSASGGQFPIFNQLSNDSIFKIRSVLERELELGDALIDFLQKTEKPPIDAIAVTYGPGLEPALWVGVNFAKALALVWDMPIIPVNHMEGHLVSALMRAETRISKLKFLISNKIPNSKFQILNSKFPILALLVSGGHTELVLSRDWLSYEIVGETRDDAAGEAFDKVARMLGLGYPGGPHIAAQAQQYAQTHADRTQTNAEKLLRDSASSPRKSASFHFPRPMLESENYDFSFSGLKTAVLYRLKELARSGDGVSFCDGLRSFRVSPRMQSEIAQEFQEAVVEVLVTKTINAAQQYGARAVLLGGGVSANTRLKEALGEKITEELNGVDFLAASREFTGDNAVMIGAAAYLRHKIAPREYPIEDIRAEGTLRIGKRLIL